jgi:threonine aldolase
MAVGEAVVFFNKELACEFDYRCKQAGQLASKMRFLAAPWEGMLKTGVWLENAAHANQMAQELHQQIKGLPGIRTLFPVEANSVFVQMPEPVIAALHQKGWHFYSFIGQGGCRLMCSWDTTLEDVNLFAADLRALLGADAG